MPADLHSALPSARGHEVPAGSRAGRIVCGWCNRTISVDDSGATRHATCSDCRGSVDLALAG